MKTLHPTLNPVVPAEAGTHSPALMDVSRIRPTPLRFRLYMLQERSESGPKNGMPSYDVEQFGTVWNNFSARPLANPNLAIGAVLCLEPDSDRASHPTPLDA